MKSICKAQPRPHPGSLLTRWRASLKEQDPNHPVITVIDYDEKTLSNIALHTPDLDAVGIIAYASLAGVRAMIDGTAYEGSYIITEWGGERPLGDQKNRLGTGHRA